MSPDKSKLKKWTAAKIKDFLAVTGEAVVRGEGGTCANFYLQTEL